MDKNNKILNRGLTVIAVVLLGVACAKISAPTGGPKDTEPPVILKSLPQNESVNFTARSFEVTFDEYVVLDRINEKFMVSPPMAAKPDIRLKGKSLVVTWEEDLKDSTTYTFYFQDAIRDNNENNPIPSYQFVFSTGPVLDSLSISGNAFNASDLEPTADVVIMLYSSMADSAPRTLPPDYISRPDMSGGFICRNMKPGSYRLYALKDFNGNKKFDLADEQFGFYDSLVVVTPENNSDVRLDSISYRPPASTETTKPDIFTFGQYKIYSFIEAPKKQYLLFTERKTSGGLSFGLALPADTSEVKVSFAGFSEKSWFLEENSRRDTFRLWVTDPEAFGQDLLKACVTYPFTDSTGTIISRSDTISFSFRHQTAPAGRSAAKQPPKTISTNLTGLLNPNIKGWFASATPLIEPDTSKMKLTQTIDSVSKTLPVILIKDTTSMRRYFFATPLKAGAAYSMVCLAGAFTDIYNVSNDSTTYKFNLQAADNYGNVILNISGYDGEIIVQLLKEKDKIVREQIVKSPGKVNFDLLDKGKYKVRIIRDLDGNRVWSTGNFSAKKQPEPVTYYNGELDVKINWELEQDWDISNMYEKDVSIRNKPEVKK